MDDKKVSTQIPFIENTTGMPTENVKNVSISAGFDDKDVLLNSQVS